MSKLSNDSDWRLMEKRFQSYSSIEDIDSPDLTFQEKIISYWESYEPYIRIDRWNSDSWKLFFLLVILILSTVAERASFKIAADRLTAYRFVLEIFLLVISVIVYCLITFLKRGLTDEITEEMRTFSHDKIFRMSILETIQFSGLLISANGVPPTMTVILLHISTPCIVLGSRYLFPNRSYSDIQMKGVYFIAIAILMSITRPIIWMITKIDFSCALSSLLYVASSAIQGISVLYKEKCIIEWSRPMDIYFLSSWLFIYQTLIALVFGPFSYMFQVISLDNKGKGYSLESFPRNFIDGYRCILGHSNVDLDNAPYNTTYTVCDHYNIPLILVYVISNVVILECVRRVLVLNNRALGRSLAVAVLFSFTALGIYDTRMDLGIGLFGTTIGYADIVSIIVLLYGMDVYGRDLEPDVEAITQFDSLEMNVLSSTTEVDSVVE